MVVSVKEKAGYTRQVSVAEMNMVNRCRSVESVGMSSKPGRVVKLGQIWRIPAYCPDGGWHEDGMNVTQAFVWNVRTYDLNVKGEIQVKKHEDESTKVRYRGGMVRSSDEGPVMGKERRNHVI